MEVKTIKQTPNGMYAIEATVDEEYVRCLLYIGDEYLMVLDKGIDIRQLIVDNNVVTAKFVVDPGPPPERYLNEYPTVCLADLV